MATALKHALTIVQHGAHKYTVTCACGFTAPALSKRDARNVKIAHLESVLRKRDA